MDQRGVHLLEARTRNVLTTYEYEGLIDFTPSINHMLIITGTDKKQSKIIVNTNQVGTREGPGNQGGDLYKFLCFPGVPDVKSDQRIYGEDHGNPREAPDRNGERE